MNRATRTLMLLGLCSVGWGCADVQDSRVTTLQTTGTLVDGYTEEPVSFGRVRADVRERARATADRNGRFSLVASDGATLTIEADGYLPIEVPARAGHHSIHLYQSSPSDGLVKEVMERRGRAQAIRDDPSDPALRAEAAAYLRGEITIEELTRLSSPEAALHLPGNPAGDRGEIGAVRAALSEPPATVRIWRRAIDGSSSSCSGRVDVLPLEEYLKGVLPHEWIPSWHENSFEAGSLAVRTYVWNWANAGGKYPCATLDDTTRSQVYRDERLARTSDAIDRTRGQALTRSGTLVSGEYSAENQDPTADGVSDPLCAGRALFGHGRGMCQWGSQRWSLDGQTPQWIATHYWPGSIIEGGGPSLRAFDAEYVGKDHPDTMVAGERAVVWLEFRNTGATSWDVSQTTVGTTGPRDRESRFFDAENWTGAARPTPPDHSDYRTGSIGRFTFMITAPEVAETETVSETFGLLQEGVVWFGPEDVTISIQVVPRGGPVVDEDTDGSSAGADCDDSDPSRYPGASEVCGDGVDQDCDGVDAICGDGDANADGGPGNLEGGIGPGSTRDRTMAEGCSAAQGLRSRFWFPLAAGLLLIASRRRSAQRRTV